MLRLLSNSEHLVFTGVVVVHAQAGKDAVEKFSFIAQTRVFFCELDDMTIEAYVATKEPMGKAGSYAIQGFGRSLVRRIDGCFFNVAGFPASEFSQKFAALVDELDKNDSEENGEQKRAKA